MQYVFKLNKNLKIESNRMFVRLSVKKIVLMILFVVSVANSFVVCAQKNNNSQEWSEFSFILKPSPLGGIGIFATHDIPAGTLVFNAPYKLRIVKIKDIPEVFLQYCIYINDEECLAPERFDCMGIGWYTNHSAIPNIAKKGPIKDENGNYDPDTEVYAIRDIKAGEEILIDYNSFDEPEHLKDDYFRRK